MLGVKNSTGTGNLVKHNYIPLYRYASAAHTRNFVSCVYMCVIIYVHINMWWGVIGRSFIWHLQTPNHINNKSTKLQSRYKWIEMFGFMIYDRHLHTQYCWTISSQLHSNGRKNIRIIVEIITWLCLYTFSPVICDGILLQLRMISTWQT